MDLDRSSGSSVKERTTQRYLGLITLLISQVVASSFLGFTFRTNALFDTLLLEEARAFQIEVSLVRRWIREHGGVYVRSGDRGQGPKRQVVDRDGEVLLQRNTSEVTQELSQLSREVEIVQFGSTSLAPLNPVNKPDDFEREALVRLRGGEEEVYRFQTVNGKLVFRYMSPLVTKKKCLNCHTDGSFQIGRVDSALTFVIPADSINQEKRINDTMGHKAGDEGLRALADIIRGNLREYDIAFRYGGEEFVLILPDANASQAMTVAERLRERVERNEITTSGGAPADRHGRLKADAVSPR